MDVHPPTHPIGTWKDFLIHLGTITIGLFIALSLQAAVEAMHHRHLVRSARVNLGREIAANQQEYTANVRRLQDNRTQLKRDIDELRQLQAGKSVDRNNLTWSWQWNSYSNAAWRAARDSVANRGAAAQNRRARSEHRLIANHHEIARTHVFERAVIEGC